MNVPSILARQMIDDGLAQVRRLAGIGIDAGANAGGKGVPDAFGRTKIGIGDPQGDDIATGVALPAQGIRRGQIRRLFKSKQVLTLPDCEPGEAR